MNVLNDMMIILIGKTLSQFPSPTRVVDKLSYSTIDSKKACLGSYLIIIEPSSSTKVLVGSICWRHVQLVYYRACSQAHGRAYSLIEPVIEF